ncbi:PHO85 cyclin-1 [Monosporozyma unispora]
METVALTKLMDGKITNEMVDELVDVTESVITIVPDSDLSKKKKLPSLRKFIIKLIDYTNVYTATLIMTLCYLRRLQDKLPANATGLPSTQHRIFLSCLILSAKNHNDSSPLNKHWTKYTDGLFTLQDVNLMERQLLSLLDWNITIREGEVLQVMRPLMAPPSPIYKLERNESVWSNLSSSSTLVNPLSQQDLNKPLREYKIVNNMKKDTGKLLKRSGKSWSLGNIMKSYGLTS